MKTTHSLLVPLVALCILSGCTTGGRQFNYERVADLDLHKVKKSEYADIFGKPLKIRDMYASGDKYQSVWYHVDYRPFAGHLSVRNLILEFKNDELNAYQYASTFREDKTDADISKVDAIEIGVTTKDDVVSLLGKPYGKSFCPSQLSYFKDNCTKAKEIWVWVMLKFRYDSRLTERKYITLMFGEDGKVIDLKAADLKD